MPAITPSTLIGTWNLVRWSKTRNGVEAGFPMTERATGQIVYGADGRMTAYLQHPDWAKKPTGTAADGNHFIAYSGDWRLDGENVVHNVRYASVPNWIGTDLVRRAVLENGNVALETAPEKNARGETMINRLVWQKIA